MTTTAAVQTYTSREVMYLLDVGYQQLWRWIDKGWIPGLQTRWAGGPGSGYQWRWTPEQVAAARVVRDHLDLARALRADPTRCHRCPCGGRS